MPAAAAIPTFASLDGFKSQRRSVSSEVMGTDPSPRRSMPGGAIMATSVGPAVREWEITVDLASPLELRLAREVWDKTARGNLPALATPPWGGSAVPVMIEEETFSRAMRTARAGTFSFTVRVYRG